MTNDAFAGRLALNSLEVYAIVAPERRLPVGNKVGSTQHGDFRTGLRAG
jgi:hypothetical protein